MLLRITIMSSPGVDSGTCRPLDAAGAVRKRRRSLGAPCWSTAIAGWSVRPARDRSARSADTEDAPPCGGAERLRNVIAGRPNCSGQRITLCAHFVARRSFLLKRRQASQQALLQRAARPNFFPSRGNTLAQTLQPFGTRCQPCRCCRSSPVPSVVSASESNPTWSVSPSLLRSARCHPMQSGERFPT